MPNIIVRIVTTLKRNILVYSIIFLVILGIGIYVAYQANQKKQTRVASAIFAKRGDVKQTLVISGKIDADEHVSLQFQASGLLAWVGVKEGDHVTKYQAIAGLDVRSTKKSLEKYLKTYLDNRWTFDQTKDDNGGKAITDRLKRVLDQSQFGLDKTILDVEIQSLAIELATISTPIEGIVTRVDAPYPGVNVTANTSLFEVANPATLFFSLSADQTDVVKIHEGDTATITLDPFPQESLKGIVDHIAFAPKQGETGSVYDVHIRLASASASLYRLGMTGDASFTTAEKINVLTIPSKYVKRDTAGTFVIVGKDRKKRSISIGLEGDTDTEITGGLQDHDLIND